MNKKVFLDDDLVAQIKGIQIKAKHLVNNSFAGDYQSSFKGRGMEFDEVRQYTPGDDVRSIDWNVTARSNAPFVKIFKDERELTVMFLVDVSASSHFGTVSKFKNEIAAEIAALLAYTALRNNDKVGLIIFSDHIEHYTPPKKGRGHVWRLIREILSYRSTAKKTDLNVPLEFLNKVIKHKAITFLISDFQGQDFGSQLSTTGKRHDLTAISILDPKEVKLPNIGYLELEDAETGESLLVNTSDKRLMGEFSKASKKKLREQKKYFRSHGIDYIRVNTDETYIRPIIEYFKKRESRLR